MSREKSEAEARINSLRGEILHHNRLYYTEGKPVISDREFDRLLEQLQGLEQQYPELITPDSPTQRVGEHPLEQFENVQHALPMLSVDNTYSPEELREFDGRIRRLLKHGDFDYIVDPKIDGVAVALRYEDGQLVQGATRGDGKTGDDITQNLRTIGSVPLRLAGDGYPAVLEVRGEVFWPREDFDRYNETLRETEKEPFKNPRNATAGTLKQLDAGIVAERGLAFQAHGYGVIEPFPEGITLHAELFARLREWGIPTSPYQQHCQDIGEVITFVDEWDTQRRAIDYETDGLVVKVNQLTLRETLGSTSKAPRWCIAYKFAAEQAESRLLTVDFQVGKLGTITPVANLEPVELAGTTVKRATLHNFDQVERLGVRVGDYVLVEKAGEIIPQVVAVVEEKRAADTTPIEVPEKCPECGGEVSKDEGGVYLRCINPACPAQFVERLKFFCGRDQMDIEGAGAKLVENLFRAGMVKSYADLYRLHERRDELVKLERMGDRSVDNLLDGIEASKKKPLARVLAALNIRHIGSTTAEELANAFGDIDSLMNASPSEIREKLAQVEDKTASKLAKQLHQYFHSLLGKQAINNVAYTADFNEQLLSLKIPGITSKRLTSRADRLKNSFGDIATLATASLEEIQDALEQKVIANAVHSYFREQDGREIIGSLKAAGLNMEQPRSTPPASSVIANKIFVITGTLEKYSRKEIEDKIKQLGGKTTSSVSKKTDYLLAGNNAGSKLANAQKLGVIVLDEAGFERLIDQV